MTEVEMANILYCINEIASEDEADGINDIKTISYKALIELIKDEIYPCKSSFETYMKYSK